MKILDPAKTCIYGPLNFPKVAMWGDSLTDQLLPGTSNEINKYKHSVL